MSKKTSCAIHVKERSKIVCQRQSIHFKLGLVHNSRPVFYSQCEGAGSGNSGRRKVVTRYHFSGQDWLVESCKRRRRVSWFYQEDKQTLSSSKSLFSNAGSLVVTADWERCFWLGAISRAVYYDNAGYLQARGPYITQGVSHHPRLLWQLIQHPRRTSPIQRNSCSRNSWQHGSESFQSPPPLFVPRKCSSSLSSSTLLLFLCYSWHTSLIGQQALCRAGCHEREGLGIPVPSAQYAIDSELLIGHSGEGSCELTRRTSFGAGGGWSEDKVSKIGSVVYFLNRIKPDVKQNSVHQSCGKGQYLESQ